MTTVHDLLTEPLLSWRDARRHRHLATLPGILEALAGRKIEDFPRVRTHQFHAWAMFLTQVAAIALNGAKKMDPNISEADWRELLLALTDGKREPWYLVAEDLSQPAFFQPPVPEAKSANWKIEDHWSAVAQPDDLDVLVLSKGHDVKAGRMSQRPESWIYALSTLQTLQGYPGRGYAPIARMNGGYGNRPRVGLSPSQALGARFNRDIRVLLETWSKLLTRGYSDDGASLVWTLPWDGKTSLPLGELAPHFIEICQRVRLRPGLRCLRTTSSARRCLGEIENGDVGDPWIPVERNGNGALTVGRRGFHYELLSRLLLGGDYNAAPAQELRQGDGDPVLFLASALARGKGKTDGLHERALELGGPVRRRLGQPDTRSALGRRAADHVKRAEEMRSKVLFPALRQLVLGEGAPRESFDARVDEAFFRELFKTVELDDDASRLAWEKKLQGIAYDELRRAIERCCVPDARRYQCIAAAEGMFSACLRKSFPDLVQEGLHP